MSRITTRALAVAVGALMVAGSAAATNVAAQAAPAKKVGSAKSAAQVAANTKAIVARVPKLAGPVEQSVPAARAESARVASTAATKAAAPANGTYISYYGYVFRVVGGAPLYVSSWNNVPKGPVTAVNTPTFNALRRYPADGTFVTATGGRVYRFVAGAPFYVTTWSVYGGAQPTIAIDRADIDHASDYTFPYDRVYDTTYDVGPTWNIPADPNATPTLDLNGSVFVSTQRGFTYKMVLGVPIYVTSWAGVGGPKPTIKVDQATIDRAGQAAPFNIVQKHLFDGVPLVAGQNGRLYITAGGSPQYTTHTQVLGTGAKWVAAKVDVYSIERAGSANPNDNLLAYPVNGTNLLAIDSGFFGGFYTVQDGRPSAIDDPGTDDFAVVDLAAVTNAGGPSPWNHLLAPLPPAS